MHAEGEMTMHQPVTGKTSFKSGWSDYPCSPVASENPVTGRSQAGDGAGAPPAKRGNAGATEGVAQW
jgi:hypothetical protein